MKVNVITINEIELPRWRIWSNWIDIAVFSFGSYGYLLQMKVSRRNAKRFHCVPFSSAWQAADATVSEAGDLTQMEKPCV